MVYSSSFKLDLLKQYETNFMVAITEVFYVTTFLNTNSTKPMIRYFMKCAI